MSWILQPHNWGQALQKNLYNVGYRRNAMYKGMGRLGQGIGPGTLNCPGDPACPDYVPPAQGPAVDPVTAQLAQMQAEIEALFGYTRAGQAPVTTNYTPWLVLGGGLLLLMMASRR